MRPELRAAHEVTLRAVKHQQTWPSRPKMPSWVVLEHYLSYDLRHAVHHFPVAHAVHYLTLGEPGAKLVQGIELKVIDRAVTRVVGSQIERVWQNGAESTVESGEEV